MIECFSGHHNSAMKFFPWRKIELEIQLEQVPKSLFRQAHQSPTRCTVAGLFKTQWPVLRPCYYAVEHIFECSPQKPKELCRTSYLRQHNFYIRNHWCFCWLNWLCLL